MNDFSQDFGAFLEGGMSTPGGAAPSVATPPASSKDGFEASFTRSLDDAVQAGNRDARTTLMDANQVDPSTAVAAARAAAEAGLPPATVERNLKTVEDAIKQRRQNDAMTENPFLAEFYKDRRNAVVAHDDFEALDTLSKIWRSGARGVSDAVAMNDAARAVRPFIGGAMDPATAAFVSRQQDQVKAPFGGDDSGFYSFVRKAAGFVGGLVDQGVKAAPAALAGGMAGGLAGSFGGPAAPITGPAGTAIGATVGFTAGMVVDGFEVGAGQLYLALKDQKDANGNPLDPDLVKYASLGGGTVLGLLNMIGMRGIERPAADAITGVVNMFIRDAVARPTTRQALATFGKGVAHSTATGSAFGLANEATMVTAEQIAKVLDDGQWATVLNDPAEFQKAMDRMLASAAEMGVAFGAMRAAGGSVRLTGDMMRARQAERDAQWVDQVNQAVTGTETVKRDRDAVKRFLEVQADGSPVENVFIPADKVVELYQSYGLDPFPLTDDPIFGFVPEFGAQLDQAIRTGGDVVIPAGDYFAKLSGTTVFDRLKGDIRVRQDGLSFREARDAAHERMARQEAEFTAWREATERGEDATTPGQRVYADVFDQLRKAGYTNDAAGQHAALFASRYQSRAERTGGDAWEAYQRSRVTVEQVLPESIRYAAPDQLDVLLNSIRSGKEPPLPKGGQTLLEWLGRRGGALDAGGELKARDLARWHLNEKGRPIKGRSPLIADPGTEGQSSMFGLGSGPRRGLDDVTLAAWEEGFFPEFTERPSIDNLLSAIDEELRGRPRMSEDTPFDPREDFRRERADLDETLNRLGLDVRKMRNGEIRDALRQVEEGDGGAGYYEQGKRGEGVDARGSIRFQDGRTIISLFRRRDLSTLLHEGGHLFLEEMRLDAMAANASDQVKADFAAIKDAIGARDKDIERHHHENFARAFEAYVMEGKAPSEGLRSAFQAFKQWLVSIYRNLSNLNAPISDELRGIFDRIIATDAEIAAARDRQSLNPIFKDAASAGMTNAEFAAYTTAARKAVERAEEETLKRAMADIRRRRTKEWREEEKGVREGVAREVMTEPGQSVLHLLRTGRLWEGETPAALAGVKLDRAEILTMFGDEEALKMLPPGIYKAEGGVRADTLAEAMGFSTGRAMVERLMGLEQQRRDLRAAGDNRSVSRYMVEEETQRRMSERHGDALTDGSIEQEALASLNNDRMAGVMSTELRALAKQAGEQRPATWSDIKEWAAATLSGKTVREATQLARYAKAERDAGNRVQRALLAGDKVAAFKAKQEQLLNMALVMEARRAIQDRDSAVRMMDRYASAKTLKAMDQSYLEQIHGLLERFDFKRATEKELERRADFAEWAIQQQAEGVDVVAPAKLINRSYQTHYTDMTLDELRGLSDTIKQIAHLGRMKKSLLVAAERREFDAMVDEAVSAVSTLRQIEKPDVHNPKEVGVGLSEKMRSWVDRFKAGARDIDSALLKMEQVFDWLDGGNAKGVFNSVVFRPIAEAQHLEARLQTQVTKKILQLNRSLPKKTVREWGERHEIPELIDADTGRPGALLKREVVAIALNMGNAGNRDKLLRGYKWDGDAVKVVLDRMLTKADWDYVQGVWDTINELWPHVEAMEKAVNGVAPEKVEPLAVETPHGTYRGGYYPVVYDPLRAGDVADRAARNSDSLFENVYTRATTSRGFTNERIQDYARPLLLSLDVIPRHVSEVVHDLAFREAIRQADKFLGDKRIREAVEGALGREVYSRFRPWLQNIANEWAMNKRELVGWENFVSKARTHASLVGMGLRMTTMMAQVSGLADSAETIGAKWVMRGMGSFVGDPVNMKRTRDFVFEKSEEMRNRMDSTERDVREALRGLVGKGGLVAESRRFAFYGIAMMDMAVTLPTWMGAYRKGLHEGMADADAVYYADKAVRSSQGAGAAKDMAAIQRGSEFQKLATMFYSYFNHLYNRQRDIVRTARDARSAGDVAMIVARSFWLMVVPAIAGNLISGQGPKEDDDWGAWAARKVGANLFSGVPILRDVVNYKERDWSGEFATYQATPAARGVDVLLKTLDDAVGALGISDKEPSDDWVKHALETSGYVFGLPTGQVGSTTQFLWDVSTGRQSPEDIADWFKGLIYGRFEDRK